MNKDQRRMDCPHYLKQLDAVFPGSEDHEDPGVREAVAHLSECESCSREFEARQGFDRQVAVRMRDVPVPAEARKRLLRQLNRGNEVQARPISADTNATPTRRSRVWKVVAPVALVLVGVAWFLNRGSESQMSMAQVQDAVSEQFASVTISQYDGLEEFDSRFDATIDDGRWNRVTNATPRGIDLDGEDGHDAAVYWMSGPVQGVLLVLKPQLVSDPPDNVSPDGPAPLYNPVRVAWLPNGSTRVHLCVLNGDADDGDLHRLLRHVIHSMTA